MGVMCFERLLLSLGLEDLLQHETLNEGLNKEVWLRDSVTNPRIIYTQILCRVQ